MKTLRAIGALLIAGATAVTGLVATSNSASAATGAHAGDDVIPVHAGSVVDYNVWANDSAGDSSFIPDGFTMRNNYNNVGTTVGEPNVLWKYLGNGIVRVQVSEDAPLGHPLPITYTQKLADGTSITAALNINTLPAAVGHVKAVADTITVPVGTATDPAKTVNVSKDIIGNDLFTAGAKIELINPSGGAGASFVRLGTTYSVENGKLIIKSDAFRPNVLLSGLNYQLTTEDGQYSMGHITIVKDSSAVVTTPVETPKPTTPPVTTQPTTPPATTPATPTTEPTTQPTTPATTTPATPTTQPTTQPTAPTTEPTTPVTTPATPTTEPTAPVTTPAEPTTQPTAPTTTPATSEPTVPVTTPATTEPTAPSTSEPTTPATTTPAEPTTDPVTPTTEPTAPITTPATTEPTAPATSNDTTPAPSKPSVPVTTTPATSEPTHTSAPAPSTTTSTTPAHTSMPKPKPSKTTTVPSKHTSVPTEHHKPATTTKHSSSAKSETKHTPTHTPSEVGAKGHAPVVKAGKHTSEHKNAMGPKVSTDYVPAHSDNDITLGSLFAAAMVAGGAGAVVIKRKRN